MNVLHINSYFMGSGFYKNLFDKQKEQGVDLRVFVPVSRKPNPQEADYGEYSVISRNHTRYDRLFFYRKQKKIFSDLVDKCAVKDFSVIHAHSLFTNGYAALQLKKEYDIPYVVAVRNTDINTFFKYMIHLRKTGIAILANAGKVIFLSKPYRDLLLERYVPEKYRQEIFEKSVIIPNGIDEFWFRNKGITGNTPSRSNLKLVYAGTVNKNKNLITTIKAIELLQKRGVHAELTVVGRIDSTSIFGHISAQKFVVYIKPQVKEELIKIYRENDIFVMASVHETFGLVYAEAMSQGLPVIYTRGQGFDEQFEEGKVGFHVDCFDPAQIADRIETIAANYVQISSNCLSASNKFNWNQISEEYIHIYEGIVHEKVGHTI